MTLHAALVDVFMFISVYIFSVSVAPGAFSVSVFSVHGCGHFREMDGVGGGEC